MEFPITDRLYGKDELKLCPFCGAVAEVRKCIDSGETAIWVECTECKAQTATVNTADTFGDIECAILSAKGAWNKRRKYKNG